MKKFLDENFLLENKTAEKLYHDYAKTMPIFDYHCHINVSEIVEDKSYKNLTELWLSGDHYKWRAMRLYGIDETYITGDKSDFEKFLAYAEVIEYAIGNPIYHWTHLELQRYFGIDETLDRSSAKSIYERATKVLQEGLTTRKLIEKSNVVALCSTDDPVDTLEQHIALKNEGYKVNVLPTFRPDKGVEIQNENFLPWVKALEKLVGNEITTFQEFLDAVTKRIDFFHSVGCRLSDHALTDVPVAEASIETVASIFLKGLKKEVISLQEQREYKFFMLKFFAENYFTRNWTMQLHIGALRNNNSKMFSMLGADTGFDSIDDKSIADGLAKFLDACNNDGLPKTILYVLNPKDNYVLGTMMGNFATGGFPTRVQFGTAWWFNDQRDGMVEQIKAYANLGIIAKFVGMLTDSRSFSSYTRHEYFRRILCNEFGKMVENGEFPQNYEALGKIVQDISYNNIETYFAL